jgi:hypothetical protein
VLDGWFVVLLEGVVVADAAHFSAHKVVVAVFAVLSVKFNKKRLLN